MRHIVFFLAVFAISFAEMSSASGEPSSMPFVAPGLWLIVSDVQTASGQHNQMRQEECWNQLGESTQASVIMGQSAVTTHNRVTNTAKQSTVQLHTFISPDIRMDQQLIFKREDRDLRHATMTGHGDMVAPGNPMMNETFTQHGHWLAADCPAVLPAAQVQVIKSAQLPGIMALQQLAARLKRADPHPNGP